ncbi:Transcription factor E2FA [Senna tora]|uniref:Transcription factor E2FA n=1 Tax=Senna tora TaxID=362788 RepID=A0A834W0I7_9FABA|nr:Transcription factor E2FA [Senna tora]
MPIIMECSLFINAFVHLSKQNETLIAIKAPHGTTLEVPDPEEAVDYPQRRYRIILRSTMGPIDVYLVSQFEEKFEEMNGIEPPVSLPLSSSSGSNEHLTTEVTPVEQNGKGHETQTQLSSHTCSDLNASQEIGGGIMKIVPSDVDNDADYWLLSDAEVSITDMWRTDSSVDWNGVDMLPPDFGIISRPQTPSSGFAEGPSTLANSTQR